MARTVRRQRGRRGGALGAAFAVAVGACGSEPPDAGPSSGGLVDGGSVAAAADAATLDAGAAIRARPRDGAAEPTADAGPPSNLVRPALCERSDRDDVVRDVVCAEQRPHIAGLADLQDVLHIAPDALAQGAATNPRVTLLAHSTALSGHLISALNPRLIIVGTGLIMAFQRGVQKVEMIATARNPGFFNFYLFEFEQACNANEQGCTAADLFTPRLERGWLSVSVSDDEDIKNTPNDCRQCHQRARETAGLLMRELNNPWTHFFQPVPPEPYPQHLGPGVQGSDLMQDYRDAKGSERYGGFSLEALDGISPFMLELTVGSDQPVLFDAPGIENERFPYDADAGYPEEPAASPTYQAAYEAFKRGEQLALPYIEARVTDSDKLTRLTQAYARYRAGELSPEELPDLSDVFPDDPRVRALIGLQTEPGASAQEVLIQACGSCHNDVLDQSLTRARFNIDLWKLDAAEIATAIERIERGPSESGVMPPPEARQLDSEGREKLLSYLRSAPQTQSPDPHLQRAAELGMAGGANRRAIERR